MAMLGVEAAKSEFVRVPNDLLEVADEIAHQIYSDFRLRYLSLNRDDMSNGWIDQNMAWAYLLRHHFAIYTNCRDNAQQIFELQIAKLLRVAQQIFGTPSDDADGLPPTIRDVAAFVYQILAIQGPCVVIENESDAKRLLTVAVAELTHLIIVEGRSTNIARLKCPALEELTLIGAAGVLPTVDFPLGFKHLTLVMCPLLITQVRPVNPFTISHRWFSPLVVEDPWMGEIDAQWYLVREPSSIATIDGEEEAQRTCCHWMQRALTTVTRCCCSSCPAETQHLLEKNTDIPSCLASMATFLQGSCFSIFGKCNAG